MVLTMEEIWYIRNVVIHLKGSVDLQESIGRIEAKFKECAIMFSKPQALILVQLVIHWSPSPLGFIKLKVDVAILKITQL